MLSKYSFMNSVLRSAFSATMSSSRSSATWPNRASSFISATCCMFVSSTRLATCCIDQDPVGGAEAEPEPFVQLLDDLRQRPELRLAVTAALGGVPAHHAVTAVRPDSDTLCWPVNSSR